MTLNPYTLTIPGFWFLAGSVAGYIIGRIDRHRPQQEPKSRRNQRKVLTNDDVLA